MLKIIGSQWSNIVLRIVAALALTPFLIETLGAEGYGIWIFLNAVVGYLSLVQAGLPASSLRHLSEQLKGGDYAGFNQTLASSLVLFSTVAALTVTAGIVLAAIAGLVFDIPQRWATDGRLAFLFATLAVSTTLLCNPIMTVLEAHGSYVARNLIEMAATVIRTVLTVILVLWSPVLTVVGVAAFVAEVCALVLLVLFVKRSHSAVRISARGWDRSKVQSLFSFSTVVLLMAVGARLAYKTDALVIGFALPMAAVSVYAVGNTLALYLSRLVNGVAEPLMPMATRMRQNGEDSALRDLFMKWSKLTMSIALLIGLYLIVLGPEFVSWWINPEFGEQVADILRILILSFVILLPASAVGFRFLLGLTRPTRLAMAHLVAGIANLALSASLVGTYGIVGVALGTAIPNVLLAAYIVFLSCREIGVRITEYLNYVLLWPLLLAVPAALLLVVMGQYLVINTVTGLALSGSVYVAFFVLLWTFIVYRNDPYFDGRARLFAILRRS